QGFIQGKVAAVRAARQRAVAQRREIMTGSSDFADLAELPVSVLDVAPRAMPPPAAAVALQPFVSCRLAEPFEKLRDASDQALARTGARPKVFLANLGKPSDFTSRATFAKSFFESGGIEAMTSDGFESPGEMAAAFKRSGGKLACLCS